MHTSQKTYLSAAGKDWLLPFYDLFTQLLGVKEIHKKLVNQSVIEASQQILEIGCGTGNLAILAKKMNPNAQVVGIDPDPKALKLARRKAERKGLNLQFDLGFAEELPYPDTSFDRVLSSFMLHHVQSDAKFLAIQEIYRVLTPGGSLHLVDFEEARRNEFGGGLHGFLASRIHGRHGSSHQQVVIDLMNKAGFEDSMEVTRQTSIMGQIVYYKAVRPGAIA